jgi:hypothetical protein
LIADRDKRFEISSAEKKKNRADIQAPPIDPAADSWKKGQTVQLTLKPMTKEASAAMSEQHEAHAEGGGKQ